MPRWKRAARTSTKRLRRSGAIALAPFISPATALASAFSSESGIVIGFQVAFMSGVYRRQPPTGNRPLRTANCHGADHLRRATRIGEEHVLPRALRGNARACEQRPDAAGARSRDQAARADREGALGREIGGGRQ